LRRRFMQSLNNFFALDAPLVNEWTLFDNSSQAQARPVENRIGGQFTLMDSDKWQNLQKHNPAA
jgi:predicted ABC-type ATPase